ncbi:uncharacterized protein LOC105703743 isoform X2 [Orussus abietinus]|uniref:uncharacterized protein LOC105703743 isoform X2 n=1 Tax=Orussus abietinus TaxID=222816 RepID=UPI000C715BA2|nr:uncharacterized protein LOC105703743 isoform X2 [Orussus abietinus]
MRNPALRLVGIAASPGGGGAFGTRAEEELRQWLEERLDALGIDPVAYSRFVLSLLRHPDSAPSPPGKPVAAGRGGRHARPGPRQKLPDQGQREQRRTVVQCLTSAADETCGIEPLVDELCAKLRELEGGGSTDDREECKTTETEPKPTLESLTPRDRALRYYAAFPALQPATPKKFSQRKDRNPGNNANNRNHANNINNNKNHSNKIRHKKTKMSIAIDSHQPEDKESYGFAKSMEREREKEREMELDRLRLAQLQAKFDESLEALWDTGTGSTLDTASIWAAPSLSIPSGPLWPSDAVDAASFSLPASEGGGGRPPETPYQESIVDDSPLIPWDIDLIGIEDFAEGPGPKDKTDYNVSWSEAIVEGPWCWRDLGSNLASLGQSPRGGGGCLYPAGPRGGGASPVGGGPGKKEARPGLKAAILPEPDEDLLTSDRTHFRPIKDDGHWADGTTFPVDNALERVAYRRSESGNLFYLPGGESPYMEYRGNGSESPRASGGPSANLTLKFRVRQCDKCVQTEPVRSPVKRRILSEQDRICYRSAGLEARHVEAPKKDSFDPARPGWNGHALTSRNDRKRRHSSSVKCRPITALRPLTL